MMQVSSLQQAAARAAGVLQHAAETAPTASRGTYQRLASQVEVQARALGAFPARVGDLAGDPINLRAEAAQALGRFADACRAAAETARGEDAEALRAHAARADATMKAVEAQAAGA